MTRIVKLHTFVLASEIRTIDTQSTIDGMAVVLTKHEGVGYIPLSVLAMLIEWLQ